MRINTTKWVFVMMGFMAVAGTVAVAQSVPMGPVANDVERPPVRRAWTRDMTTYCQVGWQNMSIEALNDELLKNGYSALTGRFRTVGIGTQMKISRRPIFLHTELNLGWGNRRSWDDPGTAGGSNVLTMSLNTFRLGAGYRIFQYRGLQLIPHIGVVSMPIRLRVVNSQRGVPTIGSVLSNSGVSQSTQLNTTAGAIDLGMTLNYRFGIQQQYDDCTNFERSLVVALDGGYRVGSRPEFLTDANPVQRVTFPSSGWYVGIRLGAGLRSDRTK